jgi:hypothetical protein
LQFRFRSDFGRAERCFAVAIALPIAPSTATTTPAPTPALARLAVAERCGFVALRLVQPLLLRRARVVVFVRYSMFGNGLFRERL